MWSIGYGCCGHNGGTVILINYTTSRPILHHANMGTDSRSPHQLFTQYSGVGSIAHYRKGVFVQYISTTFCRTVITSSISSAVVRMAPSGLLTISPQADALHLKFLPPGGFRSCHPPPSQTTAAGPWRLEWSGIPDGVFG